MLILILGTLIKTWLTTDPGALLDLYLLLLDKCFFNLGKKEKNAKGQIWAVWRVWLYTKTFSDFNNWTTVDDLSAGAF